MQLSINSSLEKSTFYKYYKERQFTFLQEQVSIKRQNCHLWYKYWHTQPPDSSTYVPVHVLVLTTRVFFPTVMSYLQHVTHIVVHAFHKSAEYFHPLFPVNELGENKTLSRLCPLTINIFFNTNFE